LTQNESKFNNTELVRAFYRRMYAGRKPLNLSADSSTFLPSWIKALFDDPIPTFSFGSGATDVAAVNPSDVQHVAAAASTFPLLAKQLPAVSVSAGMLPVSWPSVQDGLSESREMLMSVLSQTVHPLTELQIESYASHAVALLAAEVASARAEIPSYDLQGAVLLPRLREGIQTVSLYVPGAAEATPALKFDSVVRLRPSWVALHGVAPTRRATSALASELEAEADASAVVGSAPYASEGVQIRPFLEIEARVLNVDIKTSIVELRLPPLWHATQCLQCLALRGAVAFPATRTPVRSVCGHIVQCETHHIMDRALETLGKFSTCHLCELLAKTLRTSHHAISDVLRVVRWSVRFEYSFAPVTGVLRALNSLLASLPNPRDHEDAAFLASHSTMSRLFPKVGYLASSAFRQGTLARSVARLSERRLALLSAAPSAREFRNTLQDRRRQRRRVELMMKVPANVDAAASQDDTDSGDSESDAAELTVPEPYTFINGVLNAQQRSAVMAIVSGAHGPCIPYLLVGPAGTGKTSTLVEAILQVLLRVPNTAVDSPPDLRLLIVAPSDEAADLVLLAIHVALQGPVPEGFIKSRQSAVGTQSVIYSVWQ
jgi:hypothetical protein